MIRKLREIRHGGHIPGTVNNDACIFYRRPEWQNFLISEQVFHNPWQSRPQYLVFGKFIEIE